MIAQTIGRFGRRLVVLLGGEAMQSAFHLGLNIALLRVLSASDYGVFALVMVIGGLGLSYVRALTAMPASIFIGRSRTPAEANVYDVSFGSGALALGGVLGLVTALAMQLWLGSSAIGEGLFVGLWSLRSHVRTAIYARGHYMPVALGDAVYTAGGALMTLAWVVMVHTEQLTGIVSLLALANAVAIAVMLAAARRPIRISFGRSVRRRFITLWRQLGWSLASVTTTNLQGQGLALLVALIDGPAAYAPIAATLVLFAPLRIVATALVNLVQPMLSAQLARQETDRVWLQLLAWTGALVCVALLFGGAMMAALPYIKAPTLEGTPIQFMGAAAWTIYGATMLYVMPRITLEAMGALRAIALITTTGAVLGTMIIAALLLVAPPAWSLLGAVASELIVLGLSWIAVRRRVRVRGAEPVVRRFAFGQLDAKREVPL